MLFSLCHDTVFPFFSCLLFLFPCIKFSLWCPLPSVLCRNFSLQRLLFPKKRARRTQVLSPRSDFTSPRSDISGLHSPDDVCRLMHAWLSAHVLTECCKSLDNVDFIDRARGWHVSLQGHVWKKYRSKCFFDAIDHAILLCAVSCSQYVCRVPADGLRSKPRARTCRIHQVPVTFAALQ